MAEEQRCEQSNAPGLCANNCGFFGNPATLNLCSKCYVHHLVKDQRRSESEKQSLSTSAGARTASSPAVFSAVNARARDGVVSYDSSKATDTAALEKASDTASSRPARCGACRKRVGLTGFTCRCGTTYCGAHRYPEMHSCAFDFKAMGKDAIAKANPLVVAAKLDNKL